MRSIIFFLICSLAAAMIPFYQPETNFMPELETTPVWPVEYLKKKTHYVELSPRESQFYKNFPGQIIKFSDGRADYVIKWVVKPTRKLHPASDCYKGFGYTIKPEPVWQGDKGYRWSVFTATKGGRTVRIKERIFNSSGQNWPDVSGWFWSALFNHGKGPWWVVTISESVQAGH